jgi:ribosome-binding protein aMBF1 (putative translation factor)
MNMRNPAVRPVAKGLDFEEDLRRRLKDSEFAAEYAEALERATIGLKLARLRTSQGVTQAELASRAKTTQSVVSRLESVDYAGHKVETLSKLADLLDADLVLDFRPRHPKS